MSFVEFASALGLGLLALFFGEALCGVVGYAVIATASLGFVQGASAADANLKFPWHGFARSRSGRLVVEPQIAGLVGALCILCCVAVYIAWRAGAFSHASQETPSK
jgi:hypothetical protein